MVSLYAIGILLLQLCAAEVPDHACHFIDLIKVDKSVKSTMLDVRS